MPGSQTPICNDCGVFLCWDVSDADADRDREFWDAWRCEECNGGQRMRLSEWRGSGASGAEGVANRQEG